MIVKITFNDGTVQVHQSVKSLAPTAVFLQIFYDAEESQSSMLLTAEERVYGMCVPYASMKHFEVLPD